MTTKEKILELLDATDRQGIDEVMDWMKGSQFFSAPASTNFHGNYEGGLADHSYNVYTAAMRLRSTALRLNPALEEQLPEDSVTLATLLHDICKVNVYKESKRNVKDESGVWRQVPYYEFKDELPYGHGEKSVYIISGFMRLSREEAFAIRYHMGFSNEDDPRNVGAAFELFPLALALSIADTEATYFMEGKPKTNVL